MATVLVVDDEPILADAYAKILSRPGCNVIPASGPIRALEIIKSHPHIAVVLADIIMPEMRGTDLVQEIALRSPSTAFVLMTGGIVDSAEVPVGIPLLRKPISGRDLISAVEEAITRAAELRVKLQESIARHYELRWKSTQVRAECSEAASRLAETIRESRRNRE